MPSDRAQALHLVQFYSELLFKGLKEQENDKWGLSQHLFSKRDENAVQMH